MSPEDRHESSVSVLSSVDLGHIRLKGRAFYVVCLLASLFGVLMLALLVADVLWEALIGFAIGLDPITFLTHTASRDPFNAGFLAAIVGSLWLMLFTVAFSFSLGVGTAIYLEEYAADNRITRLIEANLTNLAGVPSVVYGLLALAVFVKGLSFGPIILSGSIALALLIVPIIIVSSQEALRAVPDGLRRGSYASGATKWQTIRRVVLPAAFPGIMTGTILALARAIGETAPLLMVGAVLAAGHVPGGPWNRFSAMPTEIYYWAFRPITEFQHLAAYGILVLLVIMFALIGGAIALRARYETEM